MKRFLVLAILLSTFGAAREASAGANAGENFYGYWRWRPVDKELDSQGNPVTTWDWFFNPRDACKTELQRLRDNNGIDTNYNGIKRAASYAADRNYVCKFKHDDGTQDTSSGIASEYACPSNATAFTLGDTGKQEDFRCLCNSGTCFSPSPPSPDTSTRCQPDKDVSATTVQKATVNSNRNQLLAKAYIGAEYNTYRNELAATEDCTFHPGDYKPGGPRSVNIGFLCGFRNGDEAAANKIAGFSSTPSGYTWHHNLQLGKMELVTKAAHDACGSHIGGVAVWKEAFGLQDYPLFLPKLSP